ncbi:MAG: SDR family oxidoreductase [Bacteroidales bacterium]|nr:SDR family oxidoreductase [Bacteroidales bacterium]
MERMFMNMADMKNMTAIVTGASRGIGLAIAKELADVGYNLALVGRDAETLAQAAKALRETAVTAAASSGNDSAKASPEDSGSSAAALIREANPERRVQPIVADLACEESYERIVKEAVETFGGVDLLVNCAGLSQAGSFTEVTPAQWDAIFAVNAKAPFFLCKAALPYLKASKKPIIINIASVVGFKGYINQSAYSSSKHALTGFTKVLAKEVQPFGIRVHLISPGGVATEMVKQMRPDIKPEELLQPEEVAEIVRFIVTKKGSGTIDNIYLRRYSSLAFD